jgi:hypothetical protein
MSAAIAKPVTAETHRAAVRGPIRSAAAPAAAAANHRMNDLSIDPMLLVYEERVQTLRLLARTIRRAVGSLLR